jgi:hypothetical protein
MVYLGAQKLQLLGLPAPIDAGAGRALAAGAMNGLDERVAEETGKKKNAKLP